jgi:hypothetical protein
MALTAVRAHILTELQGAGYTVGSWSGSEEGTLSFQKNTERYMCQLVNSSASQFTIILRPFSSNKRPFVFTCPIDTKELIRMSNILQRNL